MLEKNKDAQSQNLAELQQELKSLKTLLLNRGPIIPGTSTPPPAFGLAGRPSIPAWQLTSQESSMAPAASTSGSKTPSFQETSGSAPEATSSS